MKRRPDYLSDPAFSESPNGPRVPNGWGSEAGDRDPSPEQIAAMAAGAYKWPAASGQRLVGRFAIKDVSNESAVPQ